MPPDFTIAIVSGLIVTLLAAFGGLITSRYRPAWERIARRLRKRWPMGAFAVAVVFGAAVGAVLTGLAFAALSSEPELRILYDGRAIDGIVVPLQDKDFDLAGIQIRNDGSITPAPPVVTLWFSEGVAEGGRHGKIVVVGRPEPPVDITKKWDRAESTSPDFESEFHSGMLRPLNAHESWVSPRFEGRLTQAGTGPLPSVVRVRVQVFYGGGTPSEAHFTIRQPPVPASISFPPTLPAPPVNANVER